MFGFQTQVSVCCVFKGSRWIVGIFNGFLFQVFYVENIFLNHLCSFSWMLVNSTSTPPPPSRRFAPPTSRPATCARTTCCPEKTRRHHPPERRHLLKGQYGMSGSLSSVWQRDGDPSWFLCFQSILVLFLWQVLPSIRLEEVLQFYIFKNKSNLVEANLTNVV